MTITRVDSTHVWATITPSDAVIAQLSGYSVEQAEGAMKLQVALDFYDLWDMPSKEQFGYLYELHCTRNSGK